MNSVEVTPIILLLLAEKSDHGYTLHTRISDLGFEPPVLATFYGRLREMEADKLISSAWELGTGGPAKRVYSLAHEGELLMHASLPSLVRQRLAYAAAVDIYDRCRAVAP